MQKTNIPLEHSQRMWMRMSPSKYRWPTGTEKYFLPLRLSKIENTDDIKYWWECGESDARIYYCWDCIVLIPCCKQFGKKGNLAASIRIDQVIPFLRILHRRNLKGNPLRYCIQLSPTVFQNHLQMGEWLDVS